MADVTNEIMTNDKTKILSGEFLNFYTPRRQRIRSFKVYFSPKQEGSGTPSPENVRPISGWTGVEVQHCGKNLFNVSMEQGTFFENGSLYNTANRIRSEKFYLKAGTYTISCKENVQINVWRFKSNNKAQVISGGAWVNNPSTITYTEDFYVSITFRFSNNSNITPDNVNNIQLELGSQATEYTPYKTNLSIPKEYQEVEYLESTGTQLIKTDLVPQFFEEDEFYMRFAYTNTSKTQIFYGVNNNAYMLQGVLINGGLRAYDTCNYNYTGSAPFVQNEWIEYSIKNKILTCKELTGNLKDYTSNNDYILCLFGKYPETSTLSFMKLSQAYYKRDGKYLLNLIPCYRKSDKVAGMYDTVTGQFYTNSGTGEFITGPEVHPYSVDWSEDVGTVYGGYVDLVSGELVETYGKIELTGDENLGLNPWNGNGVYWQVRETSYNTAKIPFMNGQSYGNILPYYNNGHSPRTDGCFTLVGGGTVPNYTYLVLYNSNWGTTVEEYKTVLKELYDNGTPLTIVAPLKTVYHQTHQLSPTTLSTLMWDNNFWSNADRIEIEYDYIGIYDAIESRKNIFTATPHTATAKDSIISFGTDMAADLKECKVYFKPKQDLHGYDRPWIGGSGKNLIPDGKDASNGYLTNGYLNSDGTTSQGSTWYVSEYFNVVPGNTYTWSTMVPSKVGAASICFYDENKNYISGEKANGELPKTLIAPEGAVYCRASQETRSEYLCQLELGDTATTPITPYSNICPIEGWDGITVTKCGKNLVPSPSNTDFWSIKAWFDGNGEIHNNTSYIMCDYQKALPGVTYHVTISNNTWRGIGFYDLNYKPIGFIQSSKSIQLTSPNNATYYRIYAQPSSINIQLELGSEATDYEPYNAASIIIPFSQTIYGGYVDLIKGEVVETWKQMIVDENSTVGIFPWGGVKTDSSTGTEYATALFRRFNDYPKGHNWASNLCDKLPYSTSNNKINHAYFYDGDSYGPAISLSTSLIGTTNETLKQYLSGNSFVFCYQALTSSTYSIDPHTLTTLRGANTIWSNTNSDVEITYWKHNDDAYQHVPSSPITSNDNFIIVTDDGYAIGEEDDFIVY